MEVPFEYRGRFLLFTHSGHWFRSKCSFKLFVVNIFNMIMAVVRQRGYALYDEA
jgi:hypothetical protein